MKPYTYKAQKLLKLKTEYKEKFLEKEPTRLKDEIMQMSAEIKKIDKAVRQRNLY